MDGIRRDSGAQVCHEQLSKATEGEDAMRRLSWVPGKVFGGIR